MYIFPEHPDKSQEAAWIERSLRIGDYFDVLLHNKRDFSGNAFTQLARYGILLPDDQIYILVQFDTVSLWTADMLLQSQPNPLIRMIHRIFGSVFQMHLFTSDGGLYGLLVFSPPLRGEWFHWQMTNCCHRLFQLEADWDLHILISQDELGQQGIFHAANSLRHGLDYLRFFDESPRISFLDLKLQTALGNSSSLDCYHRMSVSLAEQLGDTGFQPNQAAREIAKMLREHSACSIESLHRQMQSFSLVFLNYLIDKTIIDKAFLEKNQISRCIMDGDHETVYIENLTEILSMLHKRRLELNKYFNTRRLNNVYLYIEQNIGSMALSVSQIAEQFGVNRSQLTAQFRAYYGQSLLEMIHAKRLERAKLLIESHPSWSLDQISQEAGYCSLSTMYRAFQQSSLGTPAQYRQTSKQPSGSSSDPPNCSTIRR